MTEFHSGEIPEIEDPWPQTNQEALPPLELAIVPTQPEQPPAVDDKANLIVAAASRRGRSALYDSVEIAEDEPRVAEQPPVTADEPAIPLEKLTAGTEEMAEDTATAARSAALAEASDLRRVNTLDKSNTVVTSDTAPGTGVPHEKSGRQPVFGAPAVIALTEKFEVSSVERPTGGCLGSQDWFIVKFTCFGGFGSTLIHAKSPEEAASKLTGRGNFLDKWQAAKDLRFPDKPNKDPNKESGHSQK